MAQRTATERMGLGRRSGNSWLNRPTGVGRPSVLPGLAMSVGDRDRSAPTSGGPRTQLATGLARLWSRLVLVGAVLLLGVAVVLFAFRAVYADKVYPAVAVGDVPVGGLTVEAAVAAVEARAAELERGTVTFEYGGQRWSPSLAELGATVDVAGSVEAAYALGREENAVARLGFTTTLMRADQGVPLRTVVDRGELERWFGGVDAALDQRAVDAELVVAGTVVRVEPERSGTVVDRPAATGLVLEVLGGLEPEVVPLPTVVEQPQVYAMDLAATQAQLSQALSRPLVVQFEDQQWDLDAAALSPFIVTDMARGGEGATVQLSMDEDGLAGYLRDTYSGQVNRAPEDARIAWRSGEGLVALDASVDGTTLRSSAFAEAVADSFLSDQAMVEVPVVVTHPEIDSNDLAALKINSLLARGDSNYGGQKWQRDTNVELSTDLMNGELVAPGEEFSFNEAIGTITADKGYVESGVILNGRASTGDGGGVCQTSTTVFRAAIQGGFPITDWAEHTQRLGIYEQDGWTAGYDASILQWGDDPSQWGDFKFLNDTGGYVLVQSWTEYPHLIVEIYGNDDGREVVVGDASVWEASSYPDDIEVVDESRPAGYIAQTEWPRTPAEAAFTVTTTYADGTVNEQEFYSQYRGSGNIWTVSPDMQGQSPAG